MAIGLYIHVPFCLSKCPYCDFYSLAGQDAAAMDAYAAAMEQALDRWSAQLGLTADTLYFGGGTPSLLGGARLARLVEHAARRFGLSGAEITLEANPADDLDDTLRAFAAAGGNRLSMGMQSASGEELRRLGRRRRCIIVRGLYRHGRRRPQPGYQLGLALGPGLVKPFVELSEKLRSVMLLHEGEKLRQLCNESLFVQAVLTSDVAVYIIPSTL